MSFKENRIHKETVSKQEAAGMCATHNEERRFEELNGFVILKAGVTKTAGSRLESRQQNMRHKNKGLRNGEEKRMAGSRAKKEG